MKIEFRTFSFLFLRFRWGVSDTADVDHTADVICMEEIDRCIDLSAGLNFIYLIGNRYGYLYVPLQIDEDEFDIVVEVAREQKIVNADLIEKWFLLDKNSLPAKYLYVVKNDVNFSFFLLIFDLTNSASDDVL